MSVSSLLVSLFQYKAWANGECFKGIGQLHNADEVKQAILHMDHTYVVDRIFAAHLQRISHQYSKSFNEPPLPLEQLEKAVSDNDVRLIDYVKQLDPGQFEEIIDFTFTDGDPGRMSRQEILMHLVNHGTYHRAHVRPIFARNSIVLAPDLFTGFLGQNR